VVGLAGADVEHVLAAGECERDTGCGDLLGRAFPTTSNDGCNGAPAPFAGRYRVAPVPFSSGFASAFLARIVETIGLRDVAVKLGLVERAATLVAILLDTKLIGDVGSLPLWRVADNA
jgi:hypothetical protein